MIRSRTSQDDEIEALKKEVAYLRNKLDFIRQEADGLYTWYACMSYNESYFGEPKGFVKSTVRSITYAASP